jgi:small subunit ribosomal protein S11
MGKKRVIKQTEEQLLKDKNKDNGEIKKEVKTAASSRVKEGRIYIFSSYNNTIVTLTDSQGNAVAGASAGSIGFSGTKKGTPFAASKVAEAVVASGQKMGLEKADVFVRGIGSGRDSAIRSLAAKGLSIYSIKDITPIPHNGCRPPKSRRV